MRASGILMPISSLPSPYGIGTMGAAARSFVDFLVKAGQAYWQILPVCPTSYGDSPYQSFSTFAGNPFFIDLDDLAKQGLLLPEEYASIDWECTPDCINYGVMYEKRYAVLRCAAKRLLAKPGADYRRFVKENDFWLPDYALFMALKDAAELVKMYAMVNVSQYQIVATGDTVAQCEANYRRILAEKGLVSADDADLPLTGQNEVTGVLEDIRSAVVDGNTLYYLHLTGDEHYYVISAADQPEVVIYNTGDRVTIRFADGEGTILTADSVTRTAAQTAPALGTDTEREPAA